MAPLDMLSHEFFVFPAPLAPLPPAYAPASIADEHAEAVPVREEGPDAWFQRGLLHCTGREGGIDLVQAHKWLNLAAMKGHADARAYRAEISRDMTKDQIQRAQRQARQFLS